MPFERRVYRAAEIVRSHGLAEEEVVARRERVLQDMSERAAVTPAAAPGSTPDSAPPQWAFDEDGLHTLVSAYDTHFFDGSLPHLLGGLRLDPRVVQRTGDQLGPQGATFAFCSLHPAPTAEERPSLEIVIVRAPIQALIQEAGRTQAATQFASGVYRADHCPLRIVAELVEHELCHAILYATGLSSRSNGSHGTTFVSVYKALFKPHKSYLRRYTLQGLTGTAITKLEDAERDAHCGR